MVSDPTLVASKRKDPVWLMVAPITCRRAPSSPGSALPVTIDSSTVDVPATTTPSTGNFSPGRTTTTSPRATSSIGISTSASLLSTRAVFACRPMRARMASPVPALALRLQQASEQDQRDDDADGLEVDLLNVLRQQGRRHRHYDAEAECRDGSKGDEAVHLGGSMRQGQPSGPVDRPPRVEHDRRDERELHPWFISTSGIQSTPRNSVSITANSTGAVRTAPQITRVRRSATSARRSSASASLVSSAPKPPPKAPSPRGVG